MAKVADDKSQLERFKEAARQLETDESEERFDKIVRKIATAPASDGDAKGQKK